MKELDDISQEIAQLQRYVKVSPSSQIPSLYPRLRLEVAEACEPGDRLTVTSLFRNKDSDSPEFLSDW